MLIDAKELSRNQANHLYDMTHTVDIQDILQRSNPRITVRLTGVKEFRVRLWLAARLIRFAAWISRGVVRVSDV